MLMSILSWKIKETRISVGFFQLILIYKPMLFISETRKRIWDPDWNWRINKVAPSWAFSHHAHTNFDLIWDSYKFSEIHNISGININFAIVLIQSREIHRCILNCTPKFRRRRWWRRRQIESTAELQMRRKDYDDFQFSSCGNSLCSNSGNWPCVPSLQLKFQFSRCWGEI